MKAKIISAFIILTVVVSAQIKKDYPIQPIPFTQVHVKSGFWFNRMETNRTVTIPYALKLC
ncbi:MAG: hypothetical protein HY963_07525, partial [Ignavibacteriales bacterium]|nr:hypothetical protein [Ignavibacteriales bacterium]